MSRLAGLLILAALVAVIVAALPARSAVTYKGHTARYWHGATRGQWKDRQELKRAVRVLRAENRRLRVRYKRDLSYSIRLAHALYGVATWEMWAVTRCENPRQDRYARNLSSGAYSWWQYLPSTWAAQGLPGFAADDPVASTLNTARIVARQGWSQWSCKP